MFGGFSVVKTRPRLNWLDVCTATGILSEVYAALTSIKAKPRHINQRVLVIIGPNSVLSKITTE